MGRPSSVIGRVLFGDPDDPTSRVHRIRRDVERVRPEARLDRSSRAYVFGRDNFEHVRKHGFAAELLDERPLASDVPAPAGTPTQWRHKPLAWRRALEEFDEALFLDWDVRFLGPVDVDAVFAELRKRSFFQAPLWQYRRVQVRYRGRMPGSVQPASVRQIPAAWFVYLRGDDGRHAVNRILAIMDERPNFREEHAMAMFVDQLYGGWKGVANWRRHHEPYCCFLRPSREAVRGATAEADWEPKTPLFSL